MSGKHPLEELLEGLKGMAEKAERPKEKIGELPEDIIKKRRELGYKQDELEDEVEIRVEQLKKQLERQIQREFTDRFSALNKEKDQIWDEVYERMSVDPEGSYTFNASEGILYRYIEDDKSNGFPFDLEKLKKRF